MGQKDLTRRSPYFLTEAVRALSIEGFLQSGPLLVPYETLRHYGLVGEPEFRKAERVFFGLKIQYLPDLIDSSELAGKHERERISELLDRQTKLLENISKWIGCGFSLRYIFDPERGEVQIALLGRVTAEAGHGRLKAKAVAADIQIQLETQHYPVEPVTAIDDLDYLLAPMEGLSFFEIWQLEQRTTLQIQRSFGLEETPAVVNCPFRRPAGSTWVSVLRTLVAQSQPIVVNIHVEPTQLFHFEADRLSENALIASSASSYTLKRNTYEQQITDPIAQTVARLYGDAWNRLTKGQPVLTTLQVASPTPVAAYTVAQALKVELSEEHPFGDTFHMDQLPSGSEILVASDPDDVSAALKTLQTLELHPWIASGVKDKGRLCYLMDVGAASAAFRFPIALRSGIPGIRTLRPAPAHDPGPRIDRAEPGQTYIGKRQDTGGLAVVSSDVLTRHTLITGTNGSGKTTTCFNIIAQLWEQGIPFLVVEPPKSEYRCLTQSPFGEELLIFTLGNESCSPFRLNPLEILPGVNVESHISALRAVLESSLPTFGALPAILHAALEKAYLNRGWELTDWGEENDARRMPTLGELYHEILHEVDSGGWSDRTKADIRGAAANRIGSLLRGSKGRMLNAGRSLPPKTWMSKPTILELKALNDEEKSLVMLFLLTAAREYAQTTRTSKALAHVIVIEEAHRLMTAQSHARDREISSDTSAAAVNMLSLMLSETRSTGQGMIIIDQIPSRLASDAIKNTNLKIVHQLPGRDDSEIIGATMNLNADQQKHLTILGQGEAALFVTGWQYSTFVTTENYAEAMGLPEHVPDTLVRSHMDSFQKAHVSLLLPFQGCVFCRAVCRHRDRAGYAAYSPDATKRFREVLARFKQDRLKGDTSASWSSLASHCRAMVITPPHLDGADAAYCYFVHLASIDPALSSLELTQETADRFRAAVEGE